MAQIIPFKAVRPTPDKVSLVTTRAYDEYTAAELASWLDFNPFSFLHIINPAYVNQQKIDIQQRFKMVATKYQDFLRDAVFLKDETPCLYLYKIEGKNYQFEGIMAATSVADFQKNIIKQHENTLAYRVSVLKDYFKVSGFNTEPVLMMYPQNNSLQSWIKAYQQQTPIYDFSTTNKEKHTLWRIEKASDIDYLQKTFADFDHLYIADGHHRTAASEMLYLEDSSKKEKQFFMSYLVCESSIKINEYNRVVHDLNLHTPEDFFALLEKEFVIKKMRKQLWKPSKKYEFGMYLDGEYFSLTLKEKPTESNNVHFLDAQILYDKILSTILGIGDLRTDSRIEYIPGNQSIVELFKKIDNGEYRVGFTLFPPTIEEIKFLADNQLTMPPKSTYIEPKLRNGLLIYEF